jgi:YaiO family outer membrane protein
MMKLIFKYIYILLLLQTTACVLYAQTNNDDLLGRASRAAQGGKYAEAKEIVMQVLTTDSLRTDALVMLANLNFWEGNNEIALQWIEKANEQKPRDDEFYSTYMNILLANKKFNELIAITDKAVIDIYRDELNLLQKRMIAYNQLANYEQAYESYKRTNDKATKQNPAIQALLAETLEQLQKSSINASYSIDMFNNASAQHLASVGYNYKPNKNTYGISINYANRFGMSDFQIETTNYLYVTDRQYIYANFGHGTNYKLFPQYRIGLEYYFPISKLIESSLGGRYLHYYNADNDPLNTIKRDVFIATGHLGAYIGEGWLAVRPFWVIKKDMQSLSLSLKYRKYGKSVGDFLGAELLVGNSPDDMYSISQSGFNELTSYKLRFEKSWRLNPSSDLIFAPAYGYEQYVLGTSKAFRSRFVIDIAYRLKF